MGFRRRAFYLKPGPKRQTGQSLIELALFAPLVVSVVLVFLFAGTALIYKQNLDSVARETTRVIAKNTGNGSIAMGLSRGREVATEYKLDLAKLNIIISGVSDYATPARGGSVTATITYSFGFLTFDAIPIKGQHSEIIECWRTRDDGNSGGVCTEEGAS